MRNFGGCEHMVIFIVQMGFECKDLWGFSGFWWGKFHDKRAKGRTSDRFGAFVASLTI